MSQEAADEKLYADAKDFLQKSTMAAFDRGRSRSKSGTSAIFGFPTRLQYQFDAVDSKLLLGDKKIAEHGKGLLSVGVTHVLNASMGSNFNQTNTNEEFYKQFDIVFFGIPAMDVISYDIFPYLRPAADFIDDALNNGGTVYVHCQQGISRSATVVLAYLMLKKDLDLMTALKQVREKRTIFPNDGFLRQLCKLQAEIDGQKQQNT